MREIKQLSMEDMGYRHVEGLSCPKCGGSLYWGAVGCPEGMPGCLVAHQGYVCDKCGTQFTN